MRPSKAVIVIATVSVFLAGLSLLGCSKSSSPTSPYGGTSGGGSSASNTPFDSGALNAPASFIRSFPAAGTVDYHCTFHVSMGMIGTVTIVDGAADSAAVSASGTSFAPQTVSIKPGGHVRWNVTAGTHTITSN